MKLISVKKRLPKDTTIKLVFNANCEWKGIGIAEWNFAWFDGKVWIITTRINHPWTNDWVTHWCNLPDTRGI